MSIAALETPRTFTPEDIGGEIKHFPEPGWFRKRDQSYFEPNWEDPKLKEVFDTEDKRLQLQMLIDPVKWAEKEIKIVEPLTDKVIPFKARWYQQLLLQSRDRYQVWRLGRQVGKCGTEATRVRCSDGSYITMGELFSLKQSGKPLPSIDTLTKDFKIVSTKDYGIEFNGTKPVFAVTTMMGRRIEMTGNHPVMVFRGEKPEWVKIEDLQLGDRIAVPKVGSFGKGSGLSQEELKLLGYLLGDGGLSTPYHVGFTSTSSVIMNEMGEIGDTIGFDAVKVEPNNPENYDYRLVRKPWEGSRVRGPQKTNMALELVRKVNLEGTNSHTKFIPRDIYKGTKDEIAVFLSRLFATDGWACVGEDGRRGEIGYCSVSRELADGVQSLLLKFGILANLSEKKVKYNGLVRTAFQVVILAVADIRKFANEIGIFSKEEQVCKAVDATYERKLSHNRQIETIPIGVISYIKRVATEKKMSLREIVGGDTYDNKRIRNYAPNPKKLRVYAENMDDDYLRSLCRTDIVWEPIVGIDPLGEMETYDISNVTGTNNFIANEVVVHNTICLCIIALWYAFTHANSHVLIMAPYDEQVKRIFWDRPGIEFMISNSDTLRSSQVGNITKSPPYRVHFNNGSSIVGMTAGTRSGAGGGAARGARADLILLDEADYLEDKDLNTILGIRVGRPNVKIIASSTPKGQRGMWYKWNHDPTWKTFHWPSSVVPYWDKVTEIWSDSLGRYLLFGELIVGEYDEYGLITEILAEFPEELAGVFQKYYLDIMFGDDKILEEIGEKNYSDYAYPRKPNFRTNKRIMGVDVDKYQTGPEIVIIEHDDQLDKTFILDRVTLPKGKKGELTLINLVDKIIDLQVAWKCSHIYVDRGFGEMVVENLHLYGKANPDTKLDKIVHGIFSGESIEIPDPARTGLKSKQPLKPYLVNNVVRYTERCQLVASRFDIKLKRQMEGYQVVASSSVSGQPKYTSKNEHVLDAMGFALYGMVYHFGRELAFPRGGHGVILRKTPEGKLAPTPKNRNTNLPGRGNRYITTTTNRASALRGVSGRRGAWTSHRTRRGF